MMWVQPAIRFDLRGGHGLCPKHVILDLRQPLGRSVRYPAGLVGTGQCQSMFDDGRPFTSDEIVIDPVVPEAARRALADLYWAGQRGISGFMAGTLGRVGKAGRMTRAGAAQIERDRDGHHRRPVDPIPKVTAEGTPAAHAPRQPDYADIGCFRAGLPDQGRC